MTSSLVKFTVKILWSRKCEDGVLEITSDTKVSSHESRASDMTRLLYHVWYPKPHTHISALTVLALLKNTNKGKETTNERRYPFHSSMFSYVTVKVNALTCDYIDFYCHIWEHLTMKRISLFICSYLLLVCIFQQC